ncbi:hypothetical protein [Candidatus Cryosericum septentrionale]|jgi:hypothetical protein|uniref:DUF2089 domain-containing protein n=1 Tax=Candidatus Cryosericum septentrionale TaxID=2290913 RepID=A0A398DPG4_9BACT|nr:hypothetical protein [Candidatus Cryosericum septentrionale]RIE17576.1 hypothetical protein SMC1_01240 [Candidatus Cryosericum septentrionale]
MSQEQEKIERMVQQGKLSRAEADELLATLEPQESGLSRPSIQGTQPRTRRTFRIHVDQANGKHVDLGFPMALVGVGLNILARRGKATIDLDGKEVPIDTEEIKRLIADPAFVGELMTVHTGDGDTVVLSIE